VPLKQSKLTLTESRIEIANRCTTLYYLGADPAPATPLPLGEATAYSGFHDTVVQQGKVPYATVAPGRNAALLDKFASIYYDNKYWRRIFRGLPKSRLAWPNLLPASCSLRPRIAVSPPTGFTARILPSPYVLLYPFGWSVCLSLRLLGDHTLDQLSALAASLFGEKAWSIDAGTGISLQTLLDRIADGVRTDAFGGKDNDDSESADKIVVTTVLAKHDGNPPIGGMSDQQVLQIKRLIRPEGAISKQNIDDMAVALDEKKAVDYMAIDDFGRFTWMEHLLTQADPADRHNYAWLKCYHTNSFAAFLQAWQMAGVITAAGEVKKPPVRLAELVENAKDRLQNPRFVNASIRAYLQSKEVQDLFPKAKNGEQKNGEH
jgi:hypothetical protein